MTRAPIGKCISGLHSTLNSSQLRHAVFLQLLGGRLLEGRRPHETPLRNIVTLEDAKRAITALTTCSHLCTLEALKTAVEKLKKPEQRRFPMTLHPDCYMRI